MSFNTEGEKLMSGMYQSFTAAEMAARRPMRELIKGVFPQKGIGIIYGPPEGGKSFVALDIAASIAEGRDWFGHRVIKTPVVYVVLEGVEGFGKRVRAWEKHNGRDMPGSVSFVTRARVSGSTEPDLFNLTDPANVTHLYMTARVVGAARGVVVVDTLNRASVGADENSSEGMGLIIEGMSLLQQLLDGFVLAVHHPGKDISRGMRGHSSLLGALDASLEVTESNGIRSWVPGKNKDNGKAGAEGFDLTVVDLGVDDDGDPVTSCVVTPTGIVQEGKTPKPKGDWQHLVFSTLSMLAKVKGDIYVDPQSNGAPAIEQEAAITACVEADPTNSARARDNVKRAIAAMTTAGILGGNYRHIWFLV